MSSRKGYRQEVAVGALLLAALVILAYLAVQVGAIRIEAGSKQLLAVFDHAGGVTEGAVVSVAGVTVGKVDRIWVQQDRAHMTLSIDDDLAVPVDTTAAVRARSMLGEKFVQLQPGRATALLQDGDSIAVTEAQVEIDEMVNTMAPLLQAVDPDQLGLALSSLSQALAADPQRVERMLADTEKLLRNLSEASEQAPALVTEGRAAVADLRGAVADVRPLIERSDQVLVQLEQATGPLAEASEGAPELVDQARLAIADTRELVQQLDGSTDELEQVIHNLTSFDMLALRKLAREDGVLVRFKQEEVE